MKISHFFIRAALVALSLGGLKVLGQGYSLVDLGTGAASDINNSGHVVGTTGANLAFFYDGVSVKNLPVVIFPAGSFGEGTPAAFADSSQANAINDSDVVVASGRLSTASSIDRKSTATCPTAIRLEQGLAALCFSPSILPWP